MIARSALLYTVLRLLAFLVPFGLLMLLPVFQEMPWLAAVFAALIGLSLSLLFLRRPLDEVTAGMAERRERARRSTAADDAATEDAATAAASTDDAATADAATDAAATDAPRDSDSRR